MWAERGIRPRVPKDLRCEWAYRFGAVCAERGAGATLVMPRCDAGAMTLHLAEISRDVARGVHVLPVLGGAGWHQPGGRLHDFRRRLERVGQGPCRLRFCPSTLV